MDIASPIAAGARDQDSAHAAYRAKVLKASYRYCRSLNRAHYENFPVASLLLPRQVRPAIDAIYAFARTADDFADEHEYNGQRQERLLEWRAFLANDAPTHPIFIALQDAMRRFAIPSDLLADLLRAFLQDVEKSRYANFADVLSYCRYSANPVGRLVLLVCGEGREETFLLSDAICTALQLANFWQDVAADLKKDRIYLPQDEMAAFGVTEASLADAQATDNFKKLLAAQVARAKAMFLQGQPLGSLLTGRLGVEIRLTWLCGMRVLEKIAAVDYDVFAKRPTLTKADMLRILPAALCRTRFGKDSKS